MIATPASAERVQKCVFNFQMHRFLKKKRPIYPVLWEVPDGPKRHLLSLPLLLSLGLRLFPGEFAFNHTSRPDNHNRQRHSLWGPVYWQSDTFWRDNRLKKNHGNTVMFCAVKVIDRSGGARSVVFNTHLTFTRFKVWSLRPFWLTVG